MQIIVLGMHRSGTSAVTRILNMMGAYIGPEHLIGAPAQDNKKGFWERRDVRELNDRILSVLGGAWDVPPPKEVGSLSEAEKQAFTEEANKIVFQMDTRRPWVLKDPRLNLLLDLWRPLFEVPVYVLVHRSPVEIAYSLNKRNQLPLLYGIALWEKYTLNALQSTQNEVRILSSYHDLLDNPVGFTDRLYHQLVQSGVGGLRLPGEKEIRAFIDKQLHHEREPDSQRAQLLNVQQQMFLTAFENGEIPNQPEIPVLSLGARQVLDDYRGHLQVAAARDMQIAQLNQKVMEVSSRSQSLQAELGRREGQIADFQAGLREREGQIADFQAGLRARDNQIIILNRSVESAEKQLSDVLSSWSWRLMAPIRRASRPLLERQKKKISATGAVKGKRSLFDKQARGRETQLQETVRVNEFLSPEQWNHRCKPYGVLCLPIIDWHFRFQRPQQIARCFAAEGHPVLYANLRFAAELTVEKIDAGIDALTLPGRVNTNVYREMPTDVEADCMAEAIIQYIETTENKPWVCFVQLPFWWPVAERLRERVGCFVAYDCMDDHAGFSTNGEIMLAAEERLLQNADLVFASSRLLFDKIAPSARRAVLIRNAADYDHFATVPETSHAPARELIVGYYGAIADWFDSEMVGAMAEQRPGWRFVLVGSTFSADTAALKTCPNVTFTGEQPYADLPTLIESWDCCIIPFKRCPLTEATNPVKIYEMLAAGKPVVSVDLPELRSIGEAGLIGLANTTEAFILEIERQVAQDDTWRRAARRSFASENTWQIRLQVMDQAVRELYPLVSIIVVTYNNLALNRLCIESVLNDTDYPHYEVIVVDNGSADGTPAYLKGLDHRHLSVIRNSENRGYSAANNQGLRKASGQYLCLLNNDTVVTGAWLSTLVGYLEANPKIGMVGPVTNAIANEAKIEVGYRNLLDMPAWAQNYCRQHRGKLEEISMIAFFCMVMPRHAFVVVGELDEQYGVGMFEDDDYNRRVKDAGYLVRLARDAYVHHWQRASFKLMGEDNYLKIHRENEKKYRAKWALNTLQGSDEQKITELAASSKSTRGIIVFAPSIGWSIHLFQRPQHLARALAQDGYLVIYDCSNSSDELTLLKEIEPRLYLFNGVPALFRALENPILWTFTYNYDYVDHFPAGTRVIYDWIDDLSVFPYDQNRLAELHSRALKEATRVVSVARKLHESAMHERPDAVYLPNAVEEGRFDHPKTPNSALEDRDFSRLVSSGKPIAGYYGALADWFDYDLLTTVAELRPDWLFVLIGPDHDGSIARSSIQKQRNIEWLGPRDYEDLPGYLRMFDVAMIPFKINEITLATSPLKLFEYFAGQKPVVTTAMPECSAFEEVYIAEDAEAFVNALDIARKRGQEPNYTARLAALARKNTWKARARTVIDSLEPGKVIFSSDALRIMEMFRELQNNENSHFFHALAVHLAGAIDDPCLPMYFKFAISSNERGRAVAELLAKRMEIKGKRYLDVGCAYGGFLVAFAEFGAYSTGLDINESLLKLAKSNFKDSKAEFITYRKDVTQLQDIAGFEAGYDIITCNDVIEHVDDPADAFKHIALMLAEGGVAYFEIPNRDAAAAVFRDGHYQLFGITQLDFEDASAYYAAYAPDKPYGVKHYFRLPEYRAMLEAAGLELEILDESLAGVDIQSTLAAIQELERNLASGLATVPKDICPLLETNIADYLVRMKSAKRNTESEICDFLLTYGTAFWKILAIKKSMTSIGKVQKMIPDALIPPIPEFFKEWQYQSGVCNVCGQPTRFFFQDTALYRESLTCEHCSSTSRYRSIARGLLTAIKEITGVYAPALARLPLSGVRHRIRIYDTQVPFCYKLSAYPIPEVLKSCDWIEVYLSSYKKNLPLGVALSSGVTNQNVEQLAYPDEFFDIVITSDVMEHVRLDDRAHEQIARVLRPGGIYLFTVPHNREWEANLIRVRADDPDKPENDVFLMAPEYHGDANTDDSGGILSYRAYGRELDEDLAAVGMCTDYTKQDFPEEGIFNTELFYCRKVRS
ncbi:MAG: methyltransferase domain-containing protein [Pseudomonadota bacterium]